jgi:hypothetical protein
MCRTAPIAAFPELTFRQIIPLPRDLTVYAIPYPSQATVGFGSFPTTNAIYIKESAIRENLEHPIDWIRFVAQGMGARFTY